VSWLSRKEAHYERGFFGFLSRSVHRYICNDPKLRKEIDKHVRAGKTVGFNVKVLTPEQLVQGGGVALASFLIVHAPILGMVGAPVIAGFVLLFFRIGADAFCDWSRLSLPTVKASDLERGRYDSRRGCGRSSAKTFLGHSNVSEEQHHGRPGGSRKTRSTSAWLQHHRFSDPAHPARAVAERSGV
jgi:hypothetical protein